MTVSIGGIIEAGRGFSFGRTTYANGGSYGPLLGPFVYFMLVYRGAVRVTADDTTLSLVGGECAVMTNRNSLHFSYQKHINTDVAWCEAEPTPITASNRSEQSLSAKLPASDQLKRLHAMGLDLGTTSTTAHNELRSALGRALLATYQFESRQSEIIGSTPSGVYRVRRHLDEKFAEAVTLSQLAEIAAMTPNHLVGAFRRFVGTTPIRYLWKQRAARATHLLLNTSLSSGEIAFACGYNSPYHFSRHIKELYGSSPTHLRKTKGYRTPSNSRGEYLPTRF
ncbi:helix-turn-helix domain-containing protein [bacterium]|nr:helix-turn-helix domain-containing protein [bacterium]